MSQQQFVINCIDYRYDDLVTQYFNAIGENSNYYNATTAGACLPISYNSYCQKYTSGCTHSFKKTNCVLKAGLYTNLSISQQLSDLDVIYLIDHQDCGAFKTFLPKSGYPKELGENNQREKLIHKRALELAKSKLQKRVLNTIRLGLIDVNGSVAYLNLKTRNWKLEYTGPGTNPKGLWWKT